MILGLQEASLILLIIDIDLSLLMNNRNDNDLRSPNIYANKFHNETESLEIQENCWCHIRLKINRDCHFFHKLYPDAKQLVDYKAAKNYLARLVFQTTILLPSLWKWFFAPFWIFTQYGPYWAINTFFYYYHRNAKIFDS